MPGFIRSNIATILPLLRTHLMTFTGFPIERVLIQKHTNLTDQASLQGDQVIVLTPELESMVRPQIKSAGRHDARVDRRVSVVGWNRLNTDVAFQDSDWLLQTTLGYLPFENAMINALLTWFPTDGGNNVLAVPTRCESIAAPATTRADWGSAAVSVNYQFYRDVSQAILFPGAQ